MAIEAVPTPASQPSTKRQGAEPTRLAHVTPSLRLRLPDPADRNECSLAEANDRGRRYSIDLLHRLLPGFAPAVVNGSSPTVTTVGTARLAALFDLALLDRLVDHGIDSNRIGLSNWEFLGDITNRGVTPAEAFNAGIAGRAIRDGGRMAVANIERATPGLRRFAEHLSRACSAKVAIRAVVGAGAFAGETSTSLTSEFLIVPVRGHRFVEATQPSGADQPTDSPGYRGPLGPGDALHLMPGSSLLSHPANELFVHLEVQIDRPTVRNLTPLLGELPAARMASLEWSQMPSIGDELLAHWCARLPTRSGSRFSAAVGGMPIADPWVRPAFPGGWLVVDRGTEAAAAPGERPGSLTLVAAGVGLSVELPLLRVIEETLSGPPVALADVVGRAEGADRLAQLMIDAGLLELLARPDELDTWESLTGVGPR